MKRQLAVDLERALQYARYHPAALLACIDTALSAVLPDLLITLDTVRAVQTGLRLRDWRSLCTQPDTTAWRLVESGLLATASTMIKLGRPLQHAALFAAADLMRARVAIHDRSGGNSRPPVDCFRLGYRLDTVLTGLADQCGVSAWRHALTRLLNATRAQMTIR